MCLARSLLGDAMGEGVLELNASDDRGIDVVRNKIKMFAQKKLNLPHGKHKLVFLDEADSMTAAAQQAMRRTMEIYSNTTRFVLACNQSEKIIEPIQSRCAIVRFTRLSDEQITARLKHVVDSEAVAYSPDGLAAIVFTADGDMRQAINNLQVRDAQCGLHVSSSSSLSFKCSFLHSPVFYSPHRAGLAISNLRVYTRFAINHTRKLLLVHLMHAKWATLILHMQKSNLSGTMYVLDSFVHCGPSRRHVHLSLKQEKHLPFMLVVTGIQRDRCCWHLVSGL